MREIMVFFQQEGKRERKELLFPAERPVGDLLSLLVEGLRCRTEDADGERIEYILRVYPAAQGPPDEKGLELPCDQTLTEAGVSDRSLLILCRRPEEEGDPEEVGVSTEAVEEGTKGEEDTEDRAVAVPEVEPWPWGENAWRPKVPEGKSAGEGKCLPLEEWLERIVSE